RDRRAAAPDRHRPAPVPAPACTPALRREWRRRAGNRHERGADSRAPPGQGLRDPCARRRELRARACRGARVRDAGGRIRHPGLRGGCDAGGDQARSAERSRRARGRRRRRARRRASPRRDGSRRPRARARQLRLGRHRAAARGDLRGGDHVRRHWQLLLPLGILGVAVVLIIFRGPDWGLVHDAFTAVTWEWVGAAIGLNLLSVVTRAFAWDTAIKQSIAPPHPRFPLVFSAFSVGLFANAVLPGRVGELARVAVLRRRLAGRKGTTATLVGSVFAHRMFDLFPALTLVIWVLL